MKFHNAEGGTTVIGPLSLAKGREQGTGNGGWGARDEGRGTRKLPKWQTAANGRESRFGARGSSLAACKIRDSAKARRSPLGRSEAVLGPASLFCFHVPRLACQAVMSKILSSLLRVRGAAGPEKQTEAIRTNGIANHGLASKPWHVNDPQDPRLPPVAEATRGT